MRIMFYGLQNSGATLLSLFAGQRRDSLVIPDLWTMYRAPSVDGDDDACIKVTVTSAFALDKHLASFRPDHVFLVVRRPVDNIVSLRRKPFARHDGTLEEKFAIADAYFAAPDPFTGVVVFEDFIANPTPVADVLAQVGWHLPKDADTFPRNPLEMERHIWDRAPVLYERSQWGTGQARVEPLASISLGAVEDDEAAQFCLNNCPHLHAYYERRRAMDGGLAGMVALEHSVQDESAFQGQLNFVSNQLSLFESFARLGEKQKALELAVEVCSLAPDVPEAWNAQARALDLCGKPAEAELVLRKALRSSEEGSPKEVGLHAALATHALRCGDVEQCIAIATAVVERHSGCVQAHQVLADAALRLQRFDDAQSHARALLDIAPNSVNARRAYAEGLFGSGEVEEACDWLRSCLAIAPDFQLAQQKLVQFSNSRSSAE